MSDTIHLDPEQLTELSQVVADAVAKSPMFARAALTVPEAAEACGYSVTQLYREVREGRLLTVRPGAGAQMRVMPEHLRLWLFGQRTPDDEPVMGVDPKVAERNGRKNRGK